MTKKSKEVTPEAQPAPLPQEAQELETLEVLWLPKGSVVQIAGYPFELMLDTKVKGIPANLKLALEASL